MAEAARDYYQVLGIAPDADATAVKQAFRSSARRLHPDVSADPEAEEKFRTIADAYAVLSKPASRLLYDRFGYRGRGAWAESPATAQAFSGLFEFWARSRRRPRQSSELAEVELEFYEAARGRKENRQLSEPRAVRVVRRLGGLRAEARSSRVWRAAAAAISARPTTRGACACSSS